MVKSYIVLTMSQEPITHEMWVPSLGQEDPLAEEMATYFSIFA